MHEHVPLRAVAAIDVPVTWVLCEESSPWLAGPADFVAVVREAAGEAYAKSLRRLTA
jgi:hypothetical protein